jgi:hypothetical protein
MAPRTSVREKIRLTVKGFTSSKEEGAMVIPKLPCLGALSVVAVLFAATIASAQAIGGKVTDATGGVLPGVSVTVKSPALIEQVRTAVTDGAGQYLIVELRPGSYTVTFALSGFTTIQREGIQLTSGFTATVNAELKVGDVAETVTVSGQSPVVDIQNTKQQAVMTRDLIDSVPSAKTAGGIGVLIPGIVMSQGVGGTLTQDVGGQSTNDHMTMQIHGGRGSDQQIHVDGLSIATMLRLDTVAPEVSDAPFEEIVFDYAANSAEVATGGVRVNYVPREGGNALKVRFFGNLAAIGMQSSNLDDDLRRQGFTAPNRLQKMWNIDTTVGGAIRRDRVWFFGSFTGRVTDLYVGGMYVNTNPAAWKYVADLNQQAVAENWTRQASDRLTWQATLRNKFAFFHQYTKTCTCQAAIGVTGTGGGGVSWTAPEASHYDVFNNQYYQATWSSPVTNRLLFEGGWMQAPQNQDRKYQPGAVAPTITDAASNLTYRAWIGGGTTDPNIDLGTWSGRGSMSYVTGTHALKVGFTVFGGVNASPLYRIGNQTFAVFNGVPTSVTYYGNPVTTSSYLRPDLGIYAQDQWKVQRLTVNGGLRFDYIRSGFPDQTIPPTQYVPVTRSVPGQVAIRWTDLSPRLGFAYDLFGTGRTALKASLNRYVAGPVEAGSRATALNPLSANNSVTRRWTDSNGDYIIQGDPFDPAANGELGPSTNLSFGRPVSTIAYDPSWSRGFGKRPYNWEISAGIQHEVIPRVSLNAAYFRRTFGNFAVTDNQAVSASDYSPYCVTVPVDSRLPRSGQPLCGLFDLNANAVGRISNVVRSASNYGRQEEHWQGFDLTVSARLPDVLLQGGLSSGKTLTDNCDIVARYPEVVVPSPAGQGVVLTSGPSTSTAFCRVETPFLNQLKLLGSYSLPWGIRTSATFQNFPGSQLAALAVFTSAQVAPSLGRPLSAASTVTVDVLGPAALYQNRLNQLDLRISKVFRVGQTRLEAMIDAYNILNDNTVLTSNVAYATWRTPQVILPARFAKVGVQIDF